MMTVDDKHSHLDYLNSSIDESEDVDILQETVEEMKEKQLKLETVVSQLIILIDHSEQSNCSCEHSHLKIEVKKCIHSFKKYVKGKSQIKTGDDFSLNVGATTRPYCPPDSSNFQFSNPIQPGLDISNQEQYANSSSASAVNTNVSFSAPSSLLFDSNTTISSLLNTHSFNWPTAQSIFPEKNRNASNNNFDHRGLLNAESSNQCSNSSASVCFQKSAPKLHAEAFNGDPMKWIKWYSIFKATIDQSSMSSAEKMIHLQSLLTGEAKALVDGYGSNGDLYAAALSRLQEHFGNSKRIVNVFRDKLSNFRNTNLSNPESYTQYSLFLLTLVDTFQQLGFIHDLDSTVNMNIALTKLPNPVRLEWNCYVLEKTITQPSLNALAEWLPIYAKACRDLSTNSNFPTSQNIVFIKWLGKRRTLLEIMIIRNQSINSCVTGNKRNFSLRQRKKTLIVQKMTTLKTPTNAWISELWLPWKGKIM